LIEKGDKPMPLKQKGISPLIATILLLLIVMAIAGIVWTTVFSQAESQQQQIEKQGKTFAGCANASFKVDLSTVKPTYYSSMNVTKVVLLNDGRRDLNSFNVTSFYSDGTSDVNVQSNVDIQQGGSGVVWAPSTSKPSRIEIVSNDCEGIKVSLDDTYIENA